MGLAFSCCPPHAQARYLPFALLSPGIPSPPHVQIYHHHDIFKVTHCFGLHVCARLTFVCRSSYAQCDSIWRKGL